MNPIIDRHGTQLWYKDDELHRVDGPAVIYTDGDIGWFIDGVGIRSSQLYQQLAGLSDEDMLSLILKYGSPTKENPEYDEYTNAQFWYNDYSKLHRTDGPAAIYSSSIKFWYINGVKITSADEYQQLTSLTDDQMSALITEYDGFATVYPVINEFDGTKEWFNEDDDFGDFHFMLHRDDGPARICADGQEEWYFYGQCHRDDGPAIVHPDGTGEWYLEDILITEDYIFAWRSGISSKQLYKMILTHGGLTVESYMNDEDGNKFWCDEEGEYSHEYGPAFVNSDGTLEWYIGGIRAHSADEYQQLAGLTDKEIAQLIQAYGPIV